MLLFQASPSSTVPFQPLTAWRRRKYFAAHGFWVAIVVLSVLAVWTAVVDNHGRNPVADSHKLSRRAAVIHDLVFFNSSAVDSHNDVDLDVC